MKRFNELRKISLLLLLILTSQFICGQNSGQLNGKVKDITTKAPVPFASVALLNPADSTIITGTVSGVDGQFILEHSEMKNYIVRVSHVSYQTKTLNWGTSTAQKVIFMNPNQVTMDEIVVVGERIKVKNEGSKTVYFMNNRLKKATNNGTDVLTQLPGIQMDLMRNLSLEGKQDISLMVNGRKRDLDFLTQLNSDNIDKVEIQTIAGAEMDGNTSGSINIILKEKHNGISGSVTADIPTSNQEVYLFPGYNIHYHHQNLSLFTSYSGAISNFDIIDTKVKNFSGSENTHGYKTVQNNRQNNWSHRFNLGMEYAPNKKNLFSYLGYINPYSQEHNGHVVFESENSDENNNYWSAEKKDEDMNLQNFHSLYYKYNISENNKIELDASYFHLKANNSTFYSTDSLSGPFPVQIESQTKPIQHSINLKADYTAVPTEQWSYKSGLKFDSRTITNKTDKDYRYSENVYAVYGSLSYNSEDFSFNAGLRVEHDNQNSKNQFHSENNSFLPVATFMYKMTNKQKIKLSYNRSLRRPHVYELNPVKLFTNPMMVKSGNSRLKSEINEVVFLEHSVRFNNNFLATKVFYEKTDNAIQNLLIFNDNNIFESTTRNLGKLTRLGVQIKGSLKIANMLDINPYFSIFRIKGMPHQHSDDNFLRSFSEMAYSAGLSSTASFSKGYSATFRFQYSSPTPLIQSEMFSDALYFLSFNKSINKNLKMALTTALPFDNNFTYYGNETKQNSLYSKSEGHIKTSGFPLWIKINYRFGKKSAQKTHNPNKGTNQQIKRKGF